MKRVLRLAAVLLCLALTVALGMAITAQTLPGDGAMVRNSVLFSVLIYELVGPMLTKMALTAAGDITPIPHEVKNRRQTKLAEAAEKKTQK